MCGVLCRWDWRAAVRLGLPAGGCRGRWLVAASGRAGWLWTWVACGARAWACLQAYGAEGVLGSGAARLDARSCRGLCGVPAPDGAGTPVVRVASLACGWCAEWTVAGGAEVYGLEDVEAIGFCGAPTPDGARARTFVALVAAVARDWGSVVMIVLPWVEVEELWYQALPAVILATAALPYVPGRGGGTSGCWARRATGTSLRGRDIPLHVR